MDANDIAGFGKIAENIYNLISPAIQAVLAPVQAKRQIIATAVATAKAREIEAEASKNLP
jgi:hypothetical protein